MRCVRAITTISNDIVVRSLLEAENNLVAIGQDRSSNQSWLFDHQFDEFVIGHLTAKVPVCFRARTSPREHFIN